MASNKRITPEASVVNKMVAQVGNFSKVVEAMINDLERNGVEDINPCDLYLWSDLKTISTLIEPVESILTDIIDRGQFGEDEGDSE